MRPKIVGAIMLLFVILLGGIVLLSKMFIPQATPSSAVSGKTKPASIKAAKTSATNPLLPDSGAPVTSERPVVPKVAEANASLHDQYVRERIKSLEALSWKSDNASRDAIVAVMKHDPDKAIRAAAVQAAIQFFGGRSIVEPMKEIAAQTVDPWEKASILAAIDYINLPSFTEYRKANPKSASGAVPKLQLSINPQGAPQGAPQGGASVKLESLFDFER